MPRALRRSSVLALYILFLATSARAQPPDAVGIRAQGMGGAFTAVADDATATWWNPAGLANGAYFNAILEYGHTSDTQQDHWGASAAFPALGISYYRLTVSEIQPPGTTAGSTGGSPADRQDLGTPSVRAVDLSQFGATVGQSVGQHLVIASTLKLLQAAGDSRAGLDIGAMARWSPVQFGVTVRNVWEPSFGAGETAVTLARQVRAGAALEMPGRASTLAGATLAFDADLLEVASATGNERRLAGGGEVWLWSKTIGVRAGISGSTVGGARIAATVGGSLQVHRGLFVEGQFTGGSDVTRRGWGTAFRATF
jgi:hypothetical protein